MSTLRAMVANYKDGHRWDHLDADACTKAADEIDRLRAENDAMRASVEPLQYALRWVYEHGFEHSTKCPPEVNAAFSDAYAPVRATLCARTTP